MKQTEHELYETETMAELCARQGRIHEAIAIYRRLQEGYPTSEGAGRWATRLQALERLYRDAAGREIEPAPIALPAAPGVSLAANDDSVTIAWSLRPGTCDPTLEVLLIQKTPAGVEINKRTLPLQTATGRIAFAVPALHSALAAVGRRDGDRFIPLARSERRLQ